jgi:hypothetical protein
MTKKPQRPEQAVIEELRARLAQLKSLLPTLTRPAANKAMAELLAIMGEIETARADFDPIKDPGASFDPTNPETAGRLVALALMAQDKVPLARIARTYGSGCTRFTIKATTRLMLALPVRKHQFTLERPIRRFPMLARRVIKVRNSMDALRITDA